MLRPQIRQLARQARSYSTEASSSTPVAQQLLQLAVPLVPSHGFSSQTLSAASLKLPPPHTPTSPTGFSKLTIDALFPSSPPSGRRKSKGREELVQEVMGGNAAGADEERLGPATALMEEWLKVGRVQMSKHVLESGKTGDEALKVGFRRRLRYNEEVLTMLPAALALLSIPSPTSSLAAITSLVPVASPAGYLEHVARIAQDLAYASGDESQGVAWYRTRARIATIYALAEIHLISPRSALLPHEERMSSTFALVDYLIKQSDLVAKKVDDVGLYANWIARSWLGMGRSVGLRV